MINDISPNSPNPTPAQRPLSTRPRRPGPRYGGPERFGYPKREPSRLETLEDEVRDLREFVEWLEVRLAALAIEPEP